MKRILGVVISVVCLVALLLTVSHQLGAQKSGAGPVEAFQANVIVTGLTIITEVPLDKYPVIEGIGVRFRSGISAGGYPESFNIQIEVAYKDSTGKFNLFTSYMIPYTATRMVALDGTDCYLFQASLTTNIYVPPGYFVLCTSAPGMSWSFCAQGHFLNAR